jgi:hypothetical protein
MLTWRESWLDASILSWPGRVSRQAVVTSCRIQNVVQSGEGCHVFDAAVGARGIVIPPAETGSLPRIPIRREVRFA